MVSISKPAPLEKKLRVVQEMRHCPCPLHRTLRLLRKTPFEKLKDGTLYRAALIPDLSGWQDHAIASLMISEVESHERKDKGVLIVELDEFGDRISLVEVVV